MGVASFTANNVCFPAAVSFNNTSTGPNVAYGWSFGDGQTSVQQSPSHAYNAGGNYQVTLIAITANGCADTVTQPVVVNPKPTADFTVSAVCYGATSVFTNTSSVSTGSIVAYAWSLGNGNSSILPNPTQAYASSGAFPVTLAVETDSGCADTFNSIATVYIKPTAGFMATSPCIGNPVQFTDTSGPAGQVTGFNWTFGDGGISTLQNPQHLYTTAAIYMVQQIVSTVNGCLDTVVQQDTVRGKGAAQFTAPAVCIGDSMKFTNTTSNTATYPITSYTWNLGDGSGTSTATNPVYLYGNSGNYNVILIADFTDGCADTITHPVTVYPTPTITSSIIEDSCNGASDGSIALNPATGQIPFTYAWSNGATQALNTSLAQGPYSVTFTDTHQCSATAAFNITEPPSLSADTAVTPVICAGENNGAIAVTATGGTPPYRFMWNSGDNTSAISNLSPGTYTVTLSDALGCSLTETATLPSTPPYLVQITPVVTINLGDSIQLSPTTLNGNAASWQWSPDEFLSCTDCQSPVAQPYTTFIYTVQSTSDKGCVAGNTIQVEVIPTYNVFIPNVFTPNGDGKNDFFEVFGEKSTWQFFTVQVYDRWGERVFESSDMNFEWNGSFKGKPLEPAVYVYEMRIVFIDNHTDKLYKGSVTLLR